MTFHFDEALCIEESKIFLTTLFLLNNSSGRGDEKTTSTNKHNPEIYFLTICQLEKSASDTEMFLFCDWATHIYFISFAMTHFFRLNLAPTDARGPHRVFIIFTVYYNEIPSFNDKKQKQPNSLAKNSFVRVLN